MFIKKFADPLSISHICLLHYCVTFLYLSL